MSEVTKGQVERYLRENYPDAKWGDFVGSMLDEARATLRSQERQLAEAEDRIGKLLAEDPARREGRLTPTEANAILTYLTVAGPPSLASARAKLAGIATSPLSGREWRIGPGGSTGRPPAEYLEEPTQGEGT